MNPTSTSLSSVLFNLFTLLYSLDPLHWSSFWARIKMFHCGSFSTFSKSIISFSLKPLFTFQVIPLSTRLPFQPSKSNLNRRRSKSKAVPGVVLKRHFNLISHLNWVQITRLFYVFNIFYLCTYRLYYFTSTSIVFLLFLLSPTHFGCSGFFKVHLLLQKIQFTSCIINITIWYL